MSAEQMDIRMARLEGAYEQIDRRLSDMRNDFDQRLNDIRNDFNQRFSSLESRMESGFARIDHKFTWTLGLIVGTWITTILTILFHR
jgi:DNA anti-recombination protein RmuC